MKAKRNIFILTICAAVLLTSGCYSVFSGGTGGTVVDSESTSTPKSGIANVDVYAYTDEGQRNSDFSSWSEGTTFTPSTGNYYGHTTTDANGDFTISKLVWKNTEPTFGKDADTVLVYLLFYHENYGLTKGSTLIVSDSTSDTIYQELTAVRKTTSVNLNFIDVASGSNTGNSVYVTVAVPQTTDSDTEAVSKKYTATITGSGTIAVTYPRWQNAEDKTNGVETKPAITINYVQNIEDSEISWKACKNDDTAEDYSFLETPTLTKTISGDSYVVRLYGKSTVLSYPTFGGQYKNAGDETDDGVVISLKAKASTSDTSYTLDCGQTTTFAQTIGTSATQTHGNFSGLGSGNTWKDEAYTGKYATKDVAIFVGESATPSLTKTVRSDSSSETVQLQ